ncbi:FimB/Mfa2 family fimbrial subunit [Rubrolithibacter danxiaensis]|uniref:FimB/Mfa2 family fimbrial subunit n=1 Tax=Rubrolithibacter danxiaensis TaxID=3390805 RepID=UPI003BF7BAFA
MKKNLQIVLVLCLAFFGCKKEAEPPIITTTEKGHELKLNVSGFNQKFEKLEVTSSSTSIKDKINTLYYLIYDLKGEEIRRVRQSSSDANFGSIKDTLPSGIYDVVVIGVKGDVLINGDRYDNTPPTKLKMFDGAHFELSHTLAPDFTAYDTFFTHTSVDIENEDVSSVVPLDRVVGSLEINLEDAIPANADHLSVKIAGELYSFLFDSELADGNTTADVSFSKKFSASDKGKINFKLNKLMLNTIKPMLVTISCYDSSNKLVAEKTINNVKCQRNKKLVLSGKLFDGMTTTSNFQINVNDGWQTDAGVVHF